jgi:hypothetical protein
MIGLCWLPSSPATAHWLTQEERLFLSQRNNDTNGSNGHDDDTTSGSTNNSHAPTPSASVTRPSVSASAQRHASMWTSLREPVTWLAMLTDHLIIWPLVSITLYSPAIVDELGLGSLYANLTSAIPYAVACIVMMFNARHSDRTQERYYHTQAAILLSFIGFGLLGIALYTTDNIIDCCCWHLFNITCIVSMDVHFATWPCIHVINSSDYEW